MIDAGVTPYIFTLRAGDSSVMHPSSKKLIDAGLITHQKEVKRLQSLVAVFQLFLKRPKNTFFCLIKALKSKNRWLYFQAVPFALTLLDKDIDYIHAHFADVNFLFARALSKWTGIPFGVTTHRYDLLEDPIPLAIAANNFSEAEGI